MMTARRSLLAGILIASLVLALVACGGDNDAATSTPAERAAPTATSVAPTTTSPGAVAMTPTATPSTSSSAGSTPASNDTAAIEAAARQMFDAIQRHDRDRLHDMTGGHLREHLQERDMDHLASCIPEGTTADIVNQRVAVAGDTATVTVTLQLTAADGTKSTIDRTFTFTRDATGVWQLSEMPDCPFQ